MRAMNRGSGAVGRCMALVVGLACASSRHVEVPFHSTAALAFSDRGAFALDAEAEILRCVGQSKYVPPVRSPLAVALVRAPALRSFHLAVEARSTTADYPHRDLVFVFGYQSPKRFYYVHLAPNPDPHAHGIFKVADADRVRLDPVVERGFTWGDEWHRIEIVRNVDSGAIEVTADGERLLAATDTTFDHGLVGVGSFDDAGEFRHLEFEGDSSFAVDGIELPKPLAGDSP